MIRNWQEDIHEAIREFVEVVRIAIHGHPLDAKDIRIEFLPAPHEQRESLKKGEYAVYMFMHGNQMLKCGKTKHNARFSYHHYGIKRSGSNLAKSIVDDPDYPDVTEDGVGCFIKENFLRVNLRLDAMPGKHILDFMEAFFQLKFNPKYEGRNGQTSSA